MNAGQMKEQNRCNEGQKTVTGQKAKAVAQMNHQKYKDGSLQQMLVVLSNAAVSWF